MGVPRNDPPGRITGGLLDEAIEQDFQPSGEEDLSGTAAENLQNLPPEPQFPYFYGHFTFNAANIGGSNETERVRMGIPIDQWEEGMLCCSASSDGDGFNLQAQFFETGGGSWVDLNPVLAFPASESVDTDAGFVEGSWAALNATAILQGWCVCRVNATGDSASDDIYGLILILRRAL